MRLTIIKADMVRIVKGEIPKRHLSYFAPHRQRQGYHLQVFEYLREPVTRCLVYFCTVTIIYVPDPRVARRCV